MAKPIQLPSGQWRARVWDADHEAYVFLGTYPTEDEATKRQLLAEMGIDPQEEVKAEKKIIPGTMRFDRFAEDLRWSGRHRMSRGTSENNTGNLRVHTSIRPPVTRDCVTSLPPWSRAGSTSFPKPLRGGRSTSSSIWS